MKPTLSLLSILLLCTGAHAQVVEKTVTVTPTGQVATTTRTIDRAVVRQQLSIPPKALPVQEPVPVSGSVITKQTSTTTTAPAPRVYNRERNVVTVVTENQTRELPYVTIPVLFVKDTAELLDSASADALAETAAVIKEIALQEPNALFDIEGHTSSEGTDDHNMQLSAARAKRVFDDLTTRYGVPTRLFSAHGYGENYTKYPDAPEDQLQLDRRVLVVRTQ